MRRLAFAPLALAALFAASAPSSPARATPALPGHVELVTRQGALHPWIASGELAAASSRPALDVARDVIATHAPWASSLELAHQETLRTFDGGRVVSFAQTMGGVPVFQRGVKVLVEADGRATLMTSSLEERRPATLVAAISTKTAIEAAAKSGVPADAHGARLMVLPTGGEPRLVYGVVGDFGPAIPSRPVALIDAATGEVVMRWESAHTLQKAKVYQDNPVKTPTTTEITLDNDTTKEGLQSALLDGRNCIDKHTTRDVNVGIPLTIHSCELLHTITPDASGSGDYLDILPGSDTEPEDKYAELSMYYHTGRAYQHIHAIGFPSDKDELLTAVANLRLPAGISSFDTKKMADPTIPLDPFDNGFFAAKDPLFSSAFGLDGDAMWFGQGTKVDFGYDGDVVYHEFGHFVVSRTIQLGGGFWQDSAGLSSSPGALNEALADINSFFVTDDPELGEYVSKGLGGLPGKGLRHATNSFTFPKDITGEVHQDSEPYTAAMWKVYGGLDATKKDAFQKAHLKMLLTAPTGNLGTADLAELEIKAIGDALGADVGTALRTAFEERGMKKGDPRVRTYASPGITSTVPQLGLAAPGTQDMTSKGAFAPGIIQIRFDAPAGGTAKLHVSFKVLPSQGGGGGSPFGGGGTPFAPQLLVKTGGAPLTFTYGPTKSDATVTAPCTMSSDKKSATCDTDVQVDGTAGSTAPLHLMIVNTGQTGGSYDSVVVTADAPSAPEPTTGDDAGAPTGPASDTPADGGTVKSGCGCDVPGTHTTGTAAALALALAGLVVARRRR